MPNQLRGFMKTQVVCAGSSLFLSFCALHLLTSAAEAAEPVDMNGRTALAASAAGYLVTQRGPHDRVWTKTTFETNASTGVVTSKTNSFTQVSTGLHYIEGASTRIRKT